MWAGARHPHAAAPDLPSAHGLPLPRGAGGGQEGPQQRPGGRPTAQPSSCRGRWAAAPGGAQLRLWGPPPNSHSLPVRETDGEPSDILRESSRGQGPLLRQPGSRWRCCDGNQEEKTRLACGPRGQRRGWAQAWMGGWEAKPVTTPGPLVLSLETHSWPTCVSCPFQNQAAQTYKWGEAMFCGALG